MSLTVSHMQLQAYTHKLEEKVDRLSEILKEEKEHINDFIKSEQLF